MLDDPVRNVPDTNDLVLSTCCKELSVRAEAHTSDVKIAFRARVVVLQMTDLSAVPNVEDLCRSVASSCNESTISAETHAADDTLVSQVMYQVNVKSPLHLRIEHCVPIFTLLLEVWWKLLWVILG